jgi:hypothetical protein
LCVAQNKYIVESPQISEVASDLANNIYEFMIDTPDGERYTLAYLLSPIGQYCFKNRLYFLPPSVGNENIKNFPFLPLIPTTQMYEFAKRRVVVKCGKLSSTQSGSKMSQIRITDSYKATVQILKTILKCKSSISNTSPSNPSESVRRLNEYNKKIHTDTTDTPDIPPRKGNFNLVGTKKPKRKRNRRHYSPSTSNGDDGKCLYTNKRCSLWPSTYSDFVQDFDDSCSSDSIIEDSEDDFRMEEWEYTPMNIRKEKERMFPKRKYLDFITSPDDLNNYTPQEDEVRSESSGHNNLNILSSNKFEPLELSYSSSVESSSLYELLLMSLQPTDTIHNTINELLNVDMETKAHLALENLLLVMFFEIPDQVRERVHELFTQWLRNSSTMTHLSTTTFWEQFLTNDGAISILAYIAVYLDATSTSETECERIFSQSRFIIHSQRDSMLLQTLHSILLFQKKRKGRNWMTI